MESIKNDNEKKEYITADIKKYAKEYYQQHKEKILDKMDLEHYCHLCNCDVKGSKWKRHSKGKKHQQYFLENGELIPEEEYFNIRCSKMFSTYQECFGKSANMKEFLNFFKKHHPRVKPMKKKTPYRRLKKDL